MCLFKIAPLVCVYGQTSTPDRPAPNCNHVFVVTAVTVASDYDISSVCYEAVDRGHADRGGGKG